MEKYSAWSIRKRPPVFYFGLGHRSQRPNRLRNLRCEMTKLFRREALEHQRQKLYGTILLARPPSFAVLTALFVAVAIAVVAFFFVFGFTRKATVPGVLLPDQGLVRIYPPQAGIVVERKVTDGQTVAHGDVLFVLSSERASSAQRETQTAISKALESRIERLRGELGEQRIQTRQQQAALGTRRLELEGQIEQIGTEIALQQRRVQLAEAAAQRYADLRKSSFVSEAQLQEKAADVIDQQSRLRGLERNRSALKLDLAALEGELRDQPLKARREASALERSVAEIQQDLAESEARRRIVILAPQAGVVTAIAAEPGQSVATSQTLASILQLDGRLEAELYAPTRAVGFIRPGTEVLVRYQAFPYQKFGQHRGVVREVSRTALPPGEITLPLARDPGSTDPLYRIRVALDSQSVRAYGKAEPLISGMQLEASLVLEHRKLYEWVIEPLISVTGRL
jgi:membrane fusion protein